MAIVQPALNWLLILSTILFSLCAQADRKPLWEIGAGIGTISLPHYLGSEESSNIILPVPYLVYRGQIFRSKGSGMQGILFENNRLKVDISISGSIPFDSSDNKAREDMPTLDPIFEFGPRLIVQLNSAKNNPHQWRLRLPLRAAHSIKDLHFNHRGWITNPTIRYTYEAGGNKWKITIGPIFGNASYHRYIYDVENKHVTPNRPFFRSHSGLTATRFSMSYTMRRGKWQFGLFSTYMDLRDAENNDSPLVTSNNYLSGGLAIVRIMGQSDLLVGKD